MSTTTQMSARDRILALLDANSFVEIGALVTKRNTDFNLQEKEAPSDGVITGYGVIHGKLAYIYGQDVSVMNGTMGEMHAKKIIDGRTCRVRWYLLKAGTGIWNYSADYGGGRQLRRRQCSSCIHE